MYWIEMRDWFSAGAILINTHNYASNTLVKCMHSKSTDFANTESINSR